MGKTITEKIIGKAAGREVHVGEYVAVDLSTVVLGRGSQVLPVEEITELGVNKIFDPEKIKIIVGGHDYIKPRGLRIRYLTLRGAKKYGIPDKNIIDLGAGGEEHTTSIYSGWVLPGSIYLSGHNGQTPTEGSMGCVALPLANGAGEIIAALITGKSWLQVPPTIKMNLSGKVGKGVSTRDVFEWILGKVGPDGAIGAMLEYTGPFVDELSIDSRLTLCSSSAFMGTYSAIINPDKKTIDFVKARTTDSFEPFTSDVDATFKKIYDFDVSSVEPQVVAPPKRYTVQPVKEVEGLKIDRGFIGSCNNGRLEDMRAAAEVLKGRKVKTGVLLNITPSSVEILKQSIKEGLIDTFIDARALIPTPSCSQCPGYVTPLAEDEVCISTSTCNHPGRMESMEAQIYLASPATVAASCIEGKIADPRKYL